MSDAPLSDSVLLAFLDDLLPESQMKELERRVRTEPELNARLASIIESRDRGVHSIGDIWRRHRMSCPTRDDLSRYLMNALTEEQVKYIQIHLSEVGCRYCQSNLDDLRRLQASEAVESERRRQKYLQSSIGRLPS